MINTSDRDPLVLLQLFTLLGVLLGLMVSLVVSSLLYTLFESNQVVLHLLIGLLNGLLFGFYTGGFIALVIRHIQVESNKETQLSVRACLIYGVVAPLYLIAVAGRKLSGLFVD